MMVELTPPAYFFQCAALQLPSRCPPQVTPDQFLPLPSPTKNSTPIKFGARPNRASSSKTTDEELSSKPRMHATAPNPPKC